MYSGDLYNPENVEETRRGSYKDDTAFIADYSMTISAAKHHPGQPVAPEDVRGHVAWFEFNVVFEGVREWFVDGAVMEGYWEVLLTAEQADEYSEAWLGMEGNGVGAAVVLDDNGSPFLVFDWAQPPGCSSWYGYYVGKRLVEGKDWRLTDEERGRLGIGATFRSVEQLFKEGSPGVYSEDSEEEDDFGDAGGSSEKQAVGEKRKANTDETGGKKRKAEAEETADTKKGKASTDETVGAKKTKASADETGAKKRRKRR